MSALVVIMLHVHGGLSKVLQSGLLTDFLNIASWVIGAFPWDCILY